MGNIRKNINENFSIFFKNIFENFKKEDEKALKLSREDIDEEEEVFKCSRELSSHVNHSLSLFSDEEEEEDEGRKWRTNSKSTNSVQSSPSVDLIPPDSKPFSYFPLSLNRFCIEQLFFYIC